MAPSLVTIDASEPLEKINDIIARDGGVIVSNLLSPELLNDTMNASKYPVGIKMLGEANFGLVEPYMTNRKTYDSKSTHEELGADFFPEGSQRVYVRTDRNL